MNVKLIVHPLHSLGVEMLGCEYDVSKGSVIDILTLRRMCRLYACLSMDNSSTIRYHKVIHTQWYNYLNWLGVTVQPYVSCAYHLTSRTLWNLSTFEIWLSMMKDENTQNDFVHSSPCLYPVKIVTNTYPSRDTCNIRDPICICTSQSHLNMYVWIMLLVQAP